MDADRSGGYNCIEKWLMFVQGSGELLEIEIVEGLHVYKPQWHGFLANIRS